MSKISKMSHSEKASMVGLNKKWCISRLKRMVRPNWLIVFVIFVSIIAAIIMLDSGLVQPKGYKMDAKYPEEIYIQLEEALTGAVSDGVFYSEKLPESLNFSKCVSTCEPGNEEVYVIEIVVEDETVGFPVSITGKISKDSKVDITRNYASELSYKSQCLKSSIGSFVKLSVITMLGSYVTIMLILGIGIIFFQFEQKRHLKK